MKQFINLSTLWFNTKRALYATMVIILAVSIPALSWIELSHKEDQPEKRSEITTNKVAAQSTVVLFQKQS